jgi:hypothetical protein
MYGYDKYADVLNGPWSRVGFLLVLLGLLTGFSVGLLPRVGPCKPYCGFRRHGNDVKCLGGKRWCPAPRDFFGYAGSQLLQFRRRISSTRGTN